MSAGILAENRAGSTVGRAENRRGIRRRERAPAGFKPRNFGTVRKSPEEELRRYRLVRGRAGDRGAASLADLEADEAAHSDVFADLGDHVADELANRNRLVLDEVLLVETGLLVKLFHLPVDNFLDDFLWLAGGASL